MAGEAHTLTVATTEDDAVEENETFTVSLQVSDAPSGVTVGNPVTGTIIDDDGRNEPPGFEAGAATTRAVAENTPAGGPVGNPIAAADPNGDVLIYALSGSEAFAIDSDTGQIVVSEGASLDYEAGPRSYAVTVTVNDGRDGDDVIEVTINVTDAAEPPSAPGGAEGHRRLAGKRSGRLAAAGQHRPGRERLRRPIPDAGRIGLDDPCVHGYEDHGGDRGTGVRHHL